MRTPRTKNSYLVITGAEDELGIWVGIQNPLDDFTLGTKIKTGPPLRGGYRTNLVDCNRSDFQVLLTDKNYISDDQRPRQQSRQKRKKMKGFTEEDRENAIAGSMGAREQE